MLELVITGTGLTLAVALVAYNAGIKRGMRLGQWAWQKAAEDHVKAHAAEIALGKALFDQLVRHAASRGFIGKGPQITTSMDWTHEGRAYRFTLTEGDGE